MHGSVYSDRVAERVAAWRRLGASSRVLDWIQRGVPLELVRPMAAFDRGESLVGLPAEEAAFVQAELSRLLDSGVVEEVTAAEEAERAGAGALYVSSVFLVPKKGAARFRLVIDFRPVNAHCAPGTCEVETLHLLPRTLERGDYMCALDLSDGYFHLAFRRESRKFFAFRAHGRLYQYRVLPFGWSQAPGAFTTLLALIAPDWPRARWAPLLAAWAEEVEFVPNDGRLYLRGEGRGSAPPPRWGILGYWRRPPRGGATHCAGTRERAWHRGRHSWPRPTAGPGCLTGRQSSTSSDRRCRTPATPPTGRRGSSGEATAGDGGSTRCGRDQSMYVTTWSSWPARVQSR